MRRGRDRRRGRILSRLHTVSADPNAGLQLTKLWDHDLSGNSVQESVGSLSLAHWATQVPQGHLCFKWKGITHQPFQKSLYIHFFPTHYSSTASLTLEITKRNFKYLWLFEVQKVHLPENRFFFFFFEKNLRAKLMASKAYLQHCVISGGTLSDLLRNNHR